jgi:hypothetical protein
MGTMSKAFGLLLLSLGAPVAAQDGPQDFVVQLGVTSAAECNADREERAAKYASVGAGDLLPVLRIIEAQRLVCTSFNLQEEHDRLEGEAARLEVEIARIEGNWRRDHERNPSKYPDFAGRDRSQKIMEADVRGIRGAQQGLKASIDQLRAEADRLLALALQDASELDVAGMKLLQYAADADDRRIIHDRFREFLPTGSA